MWGFPQRGVWGFFLLSHESRFSVLISDSMGKKRVPKPDLSGSALKVRNEDLELGRRIMAERSARDLAPVQAGASSAGTEMAKNAKELSKKTKDGACGSPPSPMMNLASDEADSSSNSPLADSDDDCDDLIESGFISQSDAATELKQNCAPQVFDEKPHSVPSFSESPNVSVGTDDSASLEATNGTTKASNESGPNEKSWANLFKNNRAGLKLEFDPVAAGAQR